MFGYACHETEELMPLPIMLANKLAYRLAEVRKSDPNSFLLPDGKTQVTIEYVDNVPTRVDTIVIACQYSASVSRAVLEEFIKKQVIFDVLSPELCDKNTKIIINGSGSFTIGGPFADSGTTGRKIAVDTYGGTGRIGGGCLSSKDPSKVDTTIIEEYVNTNFNFSVDNIIKELDLKKPIYYNLASYGHFGRDGYSWEKDK